MRAMYAFHLLDYIFDPVLRGPTIGCMLACLSVSVMGVVIYLRKESLIGESLSHAAYPGIIVSLFLISLLGYSQSQQWEFRILIAAGAFAASAAGYAAICFLTKKLKIRPDAALCLVLSSFFGFGIALSGPLQSHYVSLFKEVHTYLFGQAATLTDEYIWIYALFSLSNILFVWFFSKEIQLLTFDREYANTLGLRIQWLDFFLLFLVTLNLVLGMRAIGVVLISAMLIAPAVAARQYTKRILPLFLLSGTIGLACGFLGVVLSVELSAYFSTEKNLLVIPTGPIIVLAASGIALFSLLFAPERGAIYKYFYKTG